MNFKIEGLGILRYAGVEDERLLAVPKTMIADLLALVHTLDEHIGVGAALALIRDHFP